MESLFNRQGVGLALSERPATVPQTASFVETVHGGATVVQSAGDIPAGLWQQAMASHCLDHRYYEILEETLQPHFQYRYAVLRNQATGATAVQPFFLVDQDITAGLPGPFQAVINKIRTRFSRFLTMKIVMVGCAAGEGGLDSSEPWAVEALLEVIRSHARKEKASLILFKDFPSEYRERLSLLAGHGYKRAPSMPGATLDLDFSSFEDYAQTRLGRIYRKGLRRKFRDSDRAGGAAMEAVDDIAPYIDEIYPLYCQTFSRSEFKFEQLSKEYFCQLGTRMPERVRFFLWRHRGRIVAFNVCLVHEGVLHDLNVGMDYGVALDLHLYFVTWRDVISWALQQGLTTYHTGPLNYDPKLHLRLRLAPLDLYARHLSPVINPVFGLALKFLQPARHDPTIRKFPNAHEL